LREGQLVLQLGKRRCFGVVPGDIAAMGLEAKAGVGLIQLALLDGADGGESLQPILAAQRVARRIEPVR
jgi:hypothetical protein